MGRGPPCGRPGIGVFELDDIEFQKKTKLYKAGRVPLILFLLKENVLNFFKSGLSWKGAGE